MPKNKHQTHRRKGLAIFNMCLLLGASLFLAVHILRALAPHFHSVDDLRTFLDSYGWRGRLVLLGLQCIQIIVAFIPGEVLEVGAGYAYGALEGALLCLFGIAVSSTVVFLTVKRYGSSMVQRILKRKITDYLPFTNTGRKLNRAVFLAFLIPGTPKDVLTYLIGLTDMRYSTFMFLTLIARVPSVLSSTISGQILGQKEYWTGAVVYAITGVVSIIGYLLFTITVRNKNN